MTPSLASMRKVRGQSFRPPQKKQSLRKQPPSYSHNGNREQQFRMQIFWKTEKSKAVSWCTVFQKAARILCGAPKADALSHWLEQSDLEKKRWGESFSAVRYALLDVSTPAADSKAGIAEEGKNDDILHVPTSYDLKLLLKDHGKQKTHASIATSLCCLVRFCFFKTTNPQGPKRVQETDFLSISMRPRLPTTREGGRCTAHWLP